MRQRNREQRSEIRGQTAAVADGGAPAPGTSLGWVVFARHKNAVSDRFLLISDPSTGFLTPLHSEGTND